MDCFPHCIGKKHHGIVFRGVIILAVAVICVEVPTGKSLKSWSAERSKDSAAGDVRGVPPLREVDVFLIRPPGFAGLRQQIAQVQVRVLVRPAGVRVVSLKHAKIGAGLCPD